MAHDLSELLFGTPQRPQVSLYGIYIAGAAILLLGYRIKAYRYSILAFGAVVFLFYGSLSYNHQPTYADLYTQTIGGVTQAERMMDSFRAELPYMVLSLAPFLIAITLLLDRSKVRKPVEFSENVVRGPWRD